jgi:NADH-quinone oxidoreductase subunit N
MTGSSAADFVALLPVALLAGGGLIVLVSEVFLVSGRRDYQPILTTVFALVAVALALALPAGRLIFGGQATVDGFSTFVTVTVCGCLVLSTLVGAGWLRSHGVERGEFYALALFAASGMSLLGMASDLLVAFIAIEVMSLSTYALVAYQRRGKRPSEAAFKYFILGAFSSAIFLYGAALLYGATGTTLFSGFSRNQPTALFVTGFGLVAAGLAFKVAAVPFHAWTPDVYEGAPTPVTAFMAAGVKTAAFAVLARTFMAAGGEAGDGGIGGIVVVLAFLTMIFGNLLALPQRSVKRMLAYSSIAHAGYLLVGVVASGQVETRQAAVSGMLFYLASYSATVIGAFTVVGILERRSRTPDEDPVDAWDLSRFSGLSRRRPALAFSMAVFMVSLAGIPPTAGFFGKLLVFQAAVGAHAYGLAVVGVLTSALGAYYYLRVVIFMYMRPAEGQEESITSPVVSVAVALAVAVVIILGLGPQVIADLARSATALASAAPRAM